MVCVYGQYLQALLLWATIIKPWLCKKKKQPPQNSYLNYHHFISIFRSKGGAYIAHRGTWV